jgi:hypothetical protein
VHFEVNEENSALIFYKGAYHRVGELLHNRRECRYQTSAR